MAIIPLYKQRSRVSADYIAPKYDPTSEIRALEAQKDMGQTISNIGSTLINMKAKSDDADYENFALTKESEIAEARTNALLSGKYNYENVFDEVVKPMLSSIETEIGTRNYGNSKKYIARWKNDSQRITLKEQKDKLDMRVADYETKLATEANNYYKAGDFQTGDAKVQEIENFMGKEVAKKYRTSGRYGYLNNAIMQSNDPDEITRLVNDPSLTENLTFSQQQQVMTTALGRKRSLIQDTIAPAMDAADKLLKGNLLTKTYVDQLQAEGKLTPRIADNYRRSIDLQSGRFEMGLDEDVSKRDVKKIKKVKERINSYMQGNFKKDPFADLEDILDEINDTDPTPLVRSKLLSPIIDAMTDKNVNGYFAQSANHKAGAGAYTAIQSRALMSFHQQFNALTGSMPADQRDKLYMDSVFLMEDFLKGITKGYYKVDGNKIVLTKGKSNQKFGQEVYNEAFKDDGEIAPFENEINFAVANALKEVRKFAVTMPLKPRVSSINVTLDPLDEFFPER